jgi:NAD(P)-dependent dehydrogenase (short-subunit alcohol dehydrogenase family)
LTLRKTVLITGCSSGFGKATAQFFLDKGWNVIAAMRRPSDNGIEGPSDRLRVVALDVTDAKSIKAAISEATGLFGGVDVLVNNAGIGLFSPLETTSDETIRRLFETNAFSVMAMVRAIVPHMRERRSGTIVNVTSSVTFNPMPMVAVYAASKIAVDGLSEALYYELAPFGIHVKIVEPGYGPGTKFESSMMALNDANSFPAPYQGQLGVLMGSIPKDSTNNQDVAEAVFRAVNDTSPTLRFPAGADAVAIAGMRAELSEEAFLAMMRQAFAVPQQ